MAKRTISKKKTTAKKVASKKATASKKNLARPTSELAKYLKKVKDAKQAHKTAETNTNVAIRKVAQAERALKKTAASAANKKSKVTAADKKRAAATVQKAKKNVIALKAKTKVVLGKLKDAEFELNLIEKKGAAMEKAVAAFTRQWERDFNAGVREKIAARKAKKATPKKTTPKKSVTVKTVEEKTATTPEPKSESEPVPETKENPAPIVESKPTTTPGPVKPTPMPNLRLDEKIVAELTQEEEFELLGENDELAVDDYSDDDNINDDYY